MNRLYSLKRILTFIIAFAVTAGIAGSSYNSSLKIMPIIALTSIY